MLSKPDKCKGCPFYGDGKGFVPDKLVDQSEIMIYAQNPGEDEERGERWTGTDYETTTPQPLIGKTGHAMDTLYLPKTGYERNQISVGNALRCRHWHRNALPPLKSVALRKAIEHCHNAYFKLPPKVKVIITQGEYALYALTQEGMERYRKISDWRGYALPFTPINTPRVIDTEIYNPTAQEIVVLPGYHIAYTFGDPIAQLLTKWDWAKARRIIRHQWPIALPDVRQGPPSIWPAVSAFDTEFVPSNKHFLCYSLYDGKTLRVSEQLDVGIAHGDSYTVVMHNASADIPFLYRLLREPTVTVEDTMHAHAVLWSDFPHDLGFLGSLYAPINRWKHLDKVNPRTYSAADAFVTWVVWEKLKAELTRDPGSSSIYEIQKKLIPIIMRSEEAGIRVNPEESKRKYLERLVKVSELRLRAQAIAGWPISLASNQQVAQQLFEVEGLLRLVEKHKARAPKSK